MSFCAIGISGEEGLCVTHAAQATGLTVDRIHMLAKRRWTDTTVYPEAVNVSTEPAKVRLDCDRRFKQNCIVPFGIVLQLSPDLV